LEQVERVAPTGLIDTFAFGAVDTGDQRPRVGARERSKFDQTDGVGILRRPLHGGHQPAIGLAAAQRGGHHHRSTRRMPEQVSSQLERRSVRPVKVIEYYNQRLPDGKVLDQVTDSAVGAEALGRGGWLVAPGIERAQCGKHPRELAHILC
jgi:hypothetical protein